MARSSGASASERFVGRQGLAEILLRVIIWETPV
jgi:hypothetical protein